MSWAQQVGEFQTIQVRQKTLETKGLYADTNLPSSCSISHQKFAGFVFQLISAVKSDQKIIRGHFAATNSFWVFRSRNKSGLICVDELLSDVHKRWLMTTFQVKKMPKARQSTKSFCDVGVASNLATLIIMFLEVAETFFQPTFSLGKFSPILILACDSRQPRKCK